MPKSSKRFILHTDSLNSQGFRMLTEGADLVDFEKNPVMLFNHIRPEGNQKDQILPIGYWTDIELKEGQISAVPVFDDSDEFAMSIFNKVEAGVIKMASVGAEPLATTKKKEYLLPGQQLETVTRWKMKEASLCDIGSNPDAMAVALYDSSNGQITLSESKISIIQKSTMTTATDPATPPAGKKKVTQAAGDDPDKKQLESDDPQKQLEDGDDKDKQIAALKAQLADMEKKLAAAEDKLKLAQDEDDAAAKAEKLCDAAVNMRKITLAQKPHFVKLATIDYEGTLAVLKSMKAVPSVKDLLEQNAANDEGENARVVELSKKTFDELFTSKSGDLEFLKLHVPEVFKAKYKSKFGKEPKNV